MGAVLRVAVAMVMLAFGTALAMADDWIAVRLRGAVLQLVDGQWAPLRRGDVVPDSRVIRTLQRGSVEFERGAERVTVGPNSAIQIYDEVRKQPFTTVKQYFGTVTVEADVRDVQHFAVQNRYLAAVVKGTIFSVTATADGASVEVQRGAVFVRDNTTRDSETVNAGETARVDKDHRQPAVTDRSGKPVDKSSVGKPEHKASTGKPGKPDDNPGRGKPHASPGKGKAGEPSGNGKSDESPGKGKPDDPPDHDKPDDKTGKGNSGESDADNNGNGNKGKGNSGKGKSD